MTINKPYIKCEQCGNEMTGLYGYNSLAKRTKCEPCGGNKTVYNAKNPYPTEAKE